ncbi:recombinase family protein [Streptomyces fructofermentans]|uniref:Resolvase/invertase-type recombinase catalytic domain-containing protein n=1 Tax=Streptomyces fructofermentans TaxID=152141 RepID=A0A918NSV4_9ACTN|nr:recombinase family protein [Streptomyces fructofermentans]GGX93277.1 hypothetical protein GCM10010515_70260 [Streptomyces fructofermentans]
MRVSGSSGRESSLEMQEAGLRAVSTGEVVRIVQDRGSGLGLKENRRGLKRVLAMVADGSVTVLRVTHEDRPARFDAMRDAENRKRLLAESGQSGDKGGAA